MHIMIVIYASNVKEDTVYVDSKAIIALLFTVSALVVSLIRHNQ